jgi:tetratricopeptide (TPR) repeat protein
MQKTHPSMKSYWAILALFLSCSSLLFSQSNPLEKSLEKAQELIAKQKLEEAEKQITKLLDKNPGYGSAWDLLAKVKYMEYEESKKYDLLLNGNIKVTTKDKDGKEVTSDSDSLNKQLTDILSSVSPSKLAWNDFLFTLRKAQLLSYDAYSSSYYLRVLLVDREVDTAVSKKALKLFDDAEKEFGNKNYEKAIVYYKRAIEEQPDFYKAKLYLGDAYYFMKYYDEAITSFKDAVQTFPHLLEPRKYLVDAYGKRNMYGLALTEAIQAMTVYPDLTMHVKMEDAAHFSNKKIEIKWVPRAVFPNKIKAKPEGEAEKMIPKGAWINYKNAETKIRPFCDSSGIITKPNTLTKANYLEVYSWEEMLKSSKEPALEEAKKMQKLGYLDCYVLVTCFHYDFYDQYVDFVSHNKEKIIDYYNQFITPL